MKSVHRTVAVSAAAMASVAFMLAGAAGAEAATKAPVHAVSVPADSCQYRVTWPTAGVYEQPTNASTNLKDKHAGDVVGGYCDWTYYNATEGEEYLAVVTASAEDGIGWVRRDAVVKL